MPFVHATTVPSQTIGTYAVLACSRPEGPTTFAFDEVLYFIYVLRCPQRAHRRLLCLAAIVPYAGKSNLDLRFKQARTQLIGIWLFSNFGEKC